MSVKMAAAAASRSVRVSNTSRIRITENFFAYIGCLAQWGRRPIKTSRKSKGTAVWHYSTNLGPQT